MRFSSTVLVFGAVCACSSAVRGPELGDEPCEDCALTDDEAPSQGDGGGASEADAGGDSGDCPDDGWPAVVGVAPNQPTISQPMAVPPYLVETPDPRWPQSSLVRISEQRVFVPPSSGSGWNVFGPIYSARQHWNADNSLMIVTAVAVDSAGNYLPHFLNTQNHLLDGRTGAYLRACRTDASWGLPAQWRWSVTDADAVLYPEGAAIRRWRPSDDTLDVYKSFAPAYDQVSSTWGGGVNDPSVDGRYWALPLRTASGAWVVASWDALDDVITGEIPVPSEPGSPPVVAVDMARSGASIVIFSTADWTSGATQVSHGVSVWSRDGLLQRVIDIDAPPPDGAVVGVTAHNSLALDTDGDDRLVSFFTEDGIERWLVSYKLADGSRRDESPRGLMLGAYYFTAYAWNDPSLVVVSDHPVNEANTAFNGFPLRGHVWALRLDGGKAVRPLCEARYSLADFSAADWYPWTPWATPNRDGSQILLRSAMDTDWSTAGGGNPSMVHAYLVRSATACLP